MERTGSSYILTYVRRFKALGPSGDRVHRLILASYTVYIRRSVFGDECECTDKEINTRSRVGRKAEMRRVAYGAGIRCPNLDLLYVGNQTHLTIQCTFTVPLVT